MKAFDKLLSDAWDAAFALGHDQAARRIDTVQFDLRHPRLGALTETELAATKVAT